MNTTMTADEHQLIRQCLDGEPDKYAILVDRYKNMAYTIACRMLGDPDAANDVAQESFVAAYSGLKEFKYGSKFSSWLYCIVMNKCRDHLRARKDTVPVDEIIEMLRGNDPTPEQAASTRQTGDAVQQALAALPAEYREVIILKHIEGLDYREMADILKESPGALKVRAHRGREMLKKLLVNMRVGNG